MEADDLLCNGKAKTCSAGIAGTGAVQPVELFKDRLQFLLGDRSAPVGKGDLDGLFCLHRGDYDCGVPVAVGDGIFQNVIEKRGPVCLRLPQWSSNHLHEYPRCCHAPSVPGRIRRSSAVAYS